MLEEKASVEDDVPYVFQIDNMCLIASCTVGTEGQLLNIVQQFEEDEDEGKIMDMWNVYILHIYLLTLLQVFCKWIVGMVNDEAWLPDGSKISFHSLKENVEEEIVLRDNMVAQDRDDDDEGSSNNEPIVNQR